MKLSTLLDRLHGKAPKGAKRSPTWRRTRKVHLVEHPECAVCGGVFKVESHHIIPFHLAPDQEEESDKLLTLCERKKYGISCHLLVGHLGNYRRFNPNCKIDATTWHMKLKQ